MDLLDLIFGDDHAQARPFPTAITAEMPDLVHVGGRLTPEAVIDAYSRGCFPWTGEEPIPWYCPNPRLILLPRAFHASHGLRQIARQGRYQVRMDEGFAAVMRACAESPRPGQDGTWITENMHRTYGELHRRGIAHSIEVYRDTDLVGGLYGLALGAAFFGESMFFRESGTSKLALYALCLFLGRHGFDFIDCQQVTPHLRSLGAHPIPRTEYLARLSRALARPGLSGPWRLPPWTELV